MPTGMKYYPLQHLIVHGAVSLHLAPNFGHAQYILGKPRRAVYKRRFQRRACPKEDARSGRTQRLLTDVSVASTYHEWVTCAISSTRPGRVPVFGDSYQTKWQANACEGSQKRMGDREEKDVLTCLVCLAVSVAWTSQNGCCELEDGMQVAWRPMVGVLLQASCRASQENREC